MTYHFSGLNFICHVFSQFSTFSKSFCNNSESLIIHISCLSEKNGRVWDGGFICLYLYYKIPCSNCHHELIKCLRCKPRNSPGTFFGPIADYFQITLHFILATPLHVLTVIIPNCLITY